MCHTRLLAAVLPRIAHRCHKAQGHNSGILPRRVAEPAGGGRRRSQHPEHPRHGQCAAMPSPCRLCKELREQVPVKAVARVRPGR